MKRDIVIDTMLPHAPEVVWRALTTAELIGKWLMPNNFKAELGHKFTFHAKPMGDWDGTVQCEVIAICRRGGWPIAGRVARQAIRATARPSTRPSPGRSNRPTAAHG